MTGIVRVDGKTEKQWARWNVPVHKAQHESDVMEILLRIRAQNVVRGWEVDEYESDAILTINGDRYYLEVDRGTIGYRELISRMHRYATCPADVLWVFSTATRRDAAMRRTKGIPCEFWFSTFDQVVFNPHAEGIWLSRDGHTSTLEASRTTTNAST